MDGSSFDQLTKHLASGKSRRSVIRGLIGTVLGVGAVSRVTGAGAQDLGNSVCAHYCNEIFGPGKDRGVCKSQAAQSGGPCYDCGPGAPVCPEGQERNSSVAPCPCECIPVECEAGYAQNPETCACECVPVECDPGYAHDLESCACVCALTIEDCPLGVDEATCTCIQCETASDCGDPCANSCIDGACSSVPELGDGEACGTGQVCSGGMCSGNGYCATAAVGCTGTDACGGGVCGASGCKTSVEGGVACVGSGGCDITCETSETCPDGYMCSDSCCGRECMPICGGGVARVSALITDETGETGGASFAP